MVRLGTGNNSHSGFHGGCVYEPGLKSKLQLAWQGNDCNPHSKQCVFSRNPATTTHQFENHFQMCLRQAGLGSISKFLKLVPWVITRSA
jgi:hypothetical protein